MADAWVVAGIVWLVMAFTAKPTVKRQPPGLRLAQIALVACAFFLLFGQPRGFGPLAARFLPLSATGAYLGFALTLAGIVIAIWARFFLGSNWSGTPTIKHGHELIRSGPYSLVRHPIYSGLLLAVLGTAIFMGEIRGLIALALAIAGFKWKSKTEESFMQEQFGVQYLEYKRHVKALIPFVW